MDRPPNPSPNPQAVTLFSHPLSRTKAVSSPWDTTPSGAPAGSRGPGSKRCGISQSHPFCPHPELGKPVCPHSHRNHQTAEPSLPGLGTPCSLLPHRRGWAGTVPGPRGSVGTRRAPHTPAGVLHLSCSSPERHPAMAQRPACGGTHTPRASQGLHSGRRRDSPEPCLDKHTHTVDILAGTLKSGQDHKRKETLNVFLQGYTSP